MNLPEPSKPKRPVLDLAEFHRRAKASAAPVKQAKPRGMNKLEAAYARHLDWLKERGEIKDWYYEGVTLKLAEKRCRYTPDFAVVMPHGRMDFHECKGFWRDDARVKIKVAAAKFPHSMFVAVQRIKGEWVFETFPSATNPERP